MNAHNIRVDPHQTGVAKPAPPGELCRWAAEGIGLADGEPEVVEQFHGILACGTLGDG